MALTHKYIAIGNPAVQGDGNTPATPYLVSNAAEFDSIMRVTLGLGVEEFHIHIDSGTYFTKGMLYPNGTLGWNIRSGWTISGAGESATIIKLDAWPSFVTGGTPSSKWSVIGSQAAVSNVTIENLTVDGNWLNLPNDGNLPLGHPTTAEVALHCVACITNGPITHRNLTITGFYGHVATGTECFALCCHSDTPMDPDELHPSWLAVFDHCTVHHGHGDYCVGIASFNGGPSIIDSCNIYSLANESSGAIQAIGRDIQITNNIVRDCFLPFYVDTGNIINLLMERNQFISRGPWVINTNSRIRIVYINVRKKDEDGSMDGVYMDVPIRPVGETSPYYRIRLYFHLGGSTNIPDYPRDPNGDVAGIRIPCPFVEDAQMEASIDDLEGTDAGTPNGAIRDGLDAFFAAGGAPAPFVDYSRYSGAAALSPVTMYSIVDFNTRGTGTQTLTRSGTVLGTFSVNKITNLLTIGGTPGTLPTNGDIVTVSNSGGAGGALPIPLARAAEWLVQERNADDSTFKLAWIPQIVDLTTTGGTGTLTRPGNVAVGTFTADMTTNELTLSATPSPQLTNRETVYASGTLPELVAGRPYEVRKISETTLKLAWSPDPGEWIRHSAGAPFVSDESKVYIQSGWSWTNWKIRNNYLEVPFLNFGINLNQQSLIAFTGNGSTDRDYHIADNVGRFTGVYDGKKCMVF